MGDTLSKPITEKHSERKENAMLRVGASGMQGWRRGMEDAHTAILGLEGYPEYSFFGVYDGHAGQGTAEYAGRMLHRKIAEEQAFQEKNFAEAMTKGFLSLDLELKSVPKVKEETSGSTSVTALVTPTQIYCANAGDSRCVLSSGGKAVPLSEDHKPGNEQEMKRIQKAGGFVSAGRVNGNLALSRALGDFDFKNNATLPPEQQAVSPCPDVVCHDITDDDEFLVLACDGIWDVLSNEAVCDFIRKELLGGNEDLADICEKIFDKCLAPSAPGLGCDNMTMIIVLFRKSWEAKHAKRVKGQSEEETCEEPQLA